MFGFYPLAGIKLIPTYGEALTLTAQEAGIWFAAGFRPTGCVTIDASKASGSAGPARSVQARIAHAATGASGRRGAWEAPLAASQVPDAACHGQEVERDPSRIGCRRAWRTASCCRRQAFSDRGRTAGEDGSDGCKQCSHRVSAAGKGVSPRTSGYHGLAPLRGGGGPHHTTADRGLGRDRRPLRAGLSPDHTSTTAPSVLRDVCSLPRLLLDNPV